MLKYLCNSESSEVFALPPTYFCLNRLLYFHAWSALSIHFADCFLLANAGQPQLTDQNAGSAQREARNLRKQTPTVNQKWFQTMITDGATKECSYNFCVPSDSRVSQAAVYISPK